MEELLLDSVDDENQDVVTHRRDVHSGRTRLVVLVVCAL